MEDINLTLEHEEKINLSYLGIELKTKIYRNLTIERLIEEGLKSETAAAPIYISDPFM